MNTDTSHDTLDYVIAPTGNGYELRTEFDRSLVSTHRDADAAIQTALNKAAAAGGGTVLLSSGSYPIRSPLRVSTRCTLAGQGNATVLDVECECGVILDTVGQASVKDLRLRTDGHTAETGVLLNAAGSCTVTGVTAEGFRTSGICIRNGSFLCRISDCSLLGNKRAGLYAKNLAEGRAGDYIANQVSNCTVAGGGKGMEFERSIVFNVVGCACYHTHGAAFHLHTTSNSISIVGSRTFQITGSAVVVEDTHEFNCTGNIFCWATDHGIVLKNALWGTVSGNNIIDNGSYNPGGPNFHKHLSDAGDDLELKDGIRLSGCRGYSITGNALFNWHVSPPMEIPIREDSACSDNVITGNNANFYDGDVPVFSAGANTLNTDNVGWGKTPFITYGGLEENPFLQSFRTEITDRFIDGEWDIDEQVPHAQD